MLVLFLFVALLACGQATHFITKVNETVHHNVILQNNEPWNPEMYAKKIILRNLTGAVTSQSFSLLTEVEEIYFAYSSIEAVLDDAFKYNTKLKILQFSYNTHLPVITNEMLKSCKHLSKFVMGHNKKVDGISKNLFSNLLNLTHIEVTKQREIPNILTEDLFRNSRSLKSIKIHFSNVTAVDSGAFEDLYQLEFLSLVENEIVDIGVGAFKSPKLVDVYLGWNKLTSFSGKELSHLRRLRNLDISFNPLKMIDLIGIRRSAPNLSVLSLVKTSLSCDEKKSIKMQESSDFQIRMDLMEIEKCEA